MQAHKLPYRLARMSTLKDRMKQARKHAGLTQRELAQAVGVSQPVISQLESGENLQSVHLVKIAAACSVDAMWLSSGVGCMVEEEPWGSTAVAEQGADYGSADNSTVDAVKAMLANSGKGLPENVRKRLLAAAEEPSELMPPTVTGNVITADFSRPGLIGDEIRIPHYDVRAAMGGGQVPADYVELLRDVSVSQEHLRRLGVDFESPYHLKIITGWGQSMAPTIQDKDPLLIDVSIDEYTGDGIYLFTEGDMLFIKRLQLESDGQLKVISDNRNHDARYVTPGQIYIKGRVLLIWNAQKA